MRRALALGVLLGLLLVGPPPSRAADLLSEVSLFELMVEAVRLGGADRQALIAGPGGSRVVARPGDRLGRERGLIVEIGHAGVLVDQELLGPGGSPLVTRHALPLLGGRIELETTR